MSKTALCFLMQYKKNSGQTEFASVSLQSREIKSLLYVEFECWILLFGRCSGVVRRPGDTMHTLETFASLKRQQTNCCSICCFRCHLFLCVYLACCHAELPRAVEPSSSSGSVGLVESSQCSSVTQHSWEQPARQSQADRGQGTAEPGDPVGTCPEHGPRPRITPPSPHPHSTTPEDESTKLHRLNYDRLAVRQYHRCCYFCCVRKVKLPEVDTKHCYLYRVPSLVALFAQLNFNTP